MELKRTEIYEEHLKLNAKMVNFANFDMPIQYTSIKDEVASVRNAAGIFDVSHMGEFLVKGSDAENFVDHLLTNDIKNAPVGKAIYSPLCDLSGKIIDDLIAYKITEDEILICVNASNIKKDWDWMKTQSSNYDIVLTNESAQYSLFALQGPHTEKILKRLDLIDIKNLDYYSVKKSKIENTEVIIARTGYTGEDGVEIFIPNELAKTLWSWFIEAGVTPCGLAARDVLRLEVGFPLYGQELTNEITPFDCGLKWTVKMNKEDFIGKSSLSSYEISKKSFKFSIEKGIPRSGYPIKDNSGAQVGIVTSGTMSPTLGKGIAFASINATVSLQEDLFVEIRKMTSKCEIYKKPFYTGGHK